MLAADTEILGMPLAEIHGGADAGPLHWFARLCDVAPDGTVTLVTGAGRAGAPDPLRDQHAVPDAAEPAPGPAPASAPGPGPAPGPGRATAPAEAGGRAPLPLALHVTSWVFPAGHRIRLSLSNAMWPMIWPTPHPATATVRIGPGATRLMLPVIPAASQPGPASPGPALPDPVFPEPAPASAPAGVSSWGDILPVRWRHTRDDSGDHTVSWRGTSGTRFQWGRIADEEYLCYRVHDARPAQASLRGEARTEIHLPDRLLTAQSTLDLTGDETSLHYRYRRELREDGVVVAGHEWRRSYPRHGM